MKTLRDSQVSCVQQDIVCNRFLPLVRGCSPYMHCSLLMNMGEVICHARPFPEDVPVRYARELVRIDRRPGAAATNEHCSFGGTSAERSTPSSQRGG